MGAETLRTLLCQLCLAELEVLHHVFLRQGVWVQEAVGGVMCCAVVVLAMSECQHFWVFAIEPRSVTDLLHLSRRGSPDWMLLFIAQYHACTVVVYWKPCLQVQQCCVSAQTV